MHIIHRVSRRRRRHPRIRILRRGAVGGIHVGRVVVSVAGAGAAAACGLGGVLVAVFLVGVGTVVDIDVGGGVRAWGVVVGV